MTGYLQSSWNTTYKSCFILFSLFVVLVAFGIASATAAAGTSVNISSSTSTVSPGQIFITEITVNPELAIAGMQFDLHFNNSLVTVNSVTEGNLFKQSGANTLFNPGTINNAAGTVTLVYGYILGKRNISTPGTFAIINFTARNPAGESMLELFNVKISDPGGNAVPIIVSNETVRVQTTQRTVTSPLTLPKQKVPGFEALFAIAALLGFAYLLISIRRQR